MRKKDKKKLDLVPDYAILYKETKRLIVKALH